MEEIAKLEIKIEEKKLPEQSKEIFLQAENLLKQPFSFYSFGVKINAEQSREIQDQAYPKTMQSRIMQIELEKDMIFSELQSIRKMIKKFK